MKPIIKKCKSCLKEHKVMKKCKECGRYCCSECSINLICIDCFTSLNKHKEIKMYQEENKNYIIT